MGDVTGTRRRPWRLKSADGSLSFDAFRDPIGRPPAIVIRAGTEEVRYHLRCLNDLHEMLLEHEDWMALGAATEKETPPVGSVEAWARSPSNPVQGWYGLTPGRRGLFALYIPPIMAALDLAELDATSQAAAPRMKAR